MILKQDGNVWATGWNRYGQLGAGSPSGRRIVTAYVQVVSIVKGAKAVAAGSRHSMVLKQDGSVWATGLNYHGQLGDGTKVEKCNFAQVFVSGAKAIAAGGHHSMVLTQDGVVWVTGSNKRGQLGISSTSSEKGLLRFVQISNGAVHNQIVT